jgi:hypothetical protein
LPIKGHDATEVSPVRTSQNCVKAKFAESAFHAPATVLDSQHRVHKRKRPFGKEDTKMYWHNPTTQTSERVAAPTDDEGAIHTLAGHPASATFVSEYAELRRLGAPIERALVSVGHEERLRQNECMPVRLARHDRPSRRRTRPSARGYELLLALRLREEGKGRKKGSALKGEHVANLRVSAS